MMDISSVLPAGVRIRPLIDSDFKSFTALFEEIDALHREALPKLFRKTGQLLRTEYYFKDLIRDSGTLLLGAEIESEMVGLVHAIEQEFPGGALQVPRTTLLIDGLIVSSRHRKRGVGQALVNQVHQWAKKRGIVEIELKVYQFNTDAISFYEKLGYETRVKTLTKQVS